MRRGKLFCGLWVVLLGCSEARPEGQGEPGTAGDRATLEFDGEARVITDIPTETGTVYFLETGSRLGVVEVSRTSEWSLARVPDARSPLEIYLVLAGRAARDAPFELLEDHARFVAEPARLMDVLDSDQALARNLQIQSILSDRVDTVRREAGLDAAMLTEKARPQHVFSNVVSNYPCGWNLVYDIAVVQEFTTGVVPINVHCNSPNICGTAGSLARSKTSWPWVRTVGACNGKNAGSLVVVETERDPPPCGSSSCPDPVPYPARFFWLDPGEAVVYIEYGGDYVDYTEITQTSSGSGAMFAIAID